MLVYQTRSDNLGTISPAQCAFNLLTLNDYEEAGWVGTFVLENGVKNWFHEDYKLEALRDYFKLDLWVQANCVKFANQDGFDDEWKRVESNYNNNTPSWIIFRDLLDLCSKHATQNAVYFTNAVEDNHRKMHFVVSVLLLWLRTIKACWLWGQWSMNQPSMESRRLWTCRSKDRKKVTGVTFR